MHALILSGLGNRVAFAQAITWLVKAGQLRRVVYVPFDMLRNSKVLKRPFSVDLDAAIATLASRDDVRIILDGLVGEIQQEFTNTVPA